MSSPTRIRRREERAPMAIGRNSSARLTIGGTAPGRARRRRWNRFTSLHVLGQCRRRIGARGAPAIDALAEAGIAPSVGSCGDLYEMRHFSGRSQYDDGAVGEQRRAVDDVAVQHRPVLAAEGLERGVAFVDGHPRTMTVVAAVFLMRRPRARLVVLRQRELQRPSRKSSSPVRPQMCLSVLHTHARTHRNTSVLANNLLRGDCRRS